MILDIIFPSHVLMNQCKNFSLLRNIDIDNQYMWRLSDGVVK